MVENIVQINSEVMINVNVSARILEKIMSVKNIMFGILVHVLVKLVNL